jgi:hypothetical protein
MAHHELMPEDRFQRHDPMKQHFIFEGLDFPATKNDLVEFVTDAESDQDTLNLVRSLPDREYLSRDDIWRAIGEATRVFGGGGRNIGQPRDDIGKQSTTTESGVNHP